MSQPTTPQYRLVVESSEHGGYQGQVWRSTEATPGWVLVASITAPVLALVVDALMQYLWELGVE